MGAEILSTRKRKDTYGRKDGRTHRREELIIAVRKFNF